LTHPDQQNFFLGRIFDPATAKTTSQPLLYDPADLTTHAVITGMTGSGKTGLGIGLLEEAALKGLPAIVIDPKGDLTNLLLHFPDLAPQDFLPWIDPELERRQNKPIAAIAADTADRWKNGLAGVGLGQEELRYLKDKTSFTIFTPGSSAGTPVNILSSFVKPGIPWEENREILRERIATTVTALLVMVGMSNIDPLRSREHILLSNILENAWSSGKSLELMDLVLSVQKPGFDRLGAFSLENFFPEKDRFDLAMLLNNFLASPSFQTWLEGQNLDVSALQFNSNGQPRHSIFYLAHLSDTERMFFVTLLFSAIETWMRSQRGTSGLRMLIYFDEVMGFLPPVGNPASRTILLRMLKQARAFGIGLVLATQNPVDLDYKALSNAGTWLIGRLQTDQDKQRLLDGLEGAAGQGLDRSFADKMISNLPKRVFLYQNVRASGLQLFETRWTLNYLAGPMTRAQIPALNQLAAPAQKSASAPVSSVEQTAAADFSVPVSATRLEQPDVQSGDGQLASSAPKNAAVYLNTRPPLPAGIDDFFWPVELEISSAVEIYKLPMSGELHPEGILYKPSLFAQAEIYYLARKYNVEYKTHQAVMVSEESPRVMRWDEFSWEPVDEKSLLSTPLPNTQFAGLPGWLSDPRRMKDLRADFADWLYRDGGIRLRSNDLLKVYAGPGVSSVEFREMCSQTAKKLMEDEMNKLEAVYEKKLDGLNEKIRKQISDVEEQKNEVDQRRMEEFGTHGELLLSLFTRRKRSLSTSLTKRRLTSQARADLENEQQELQMLQEQMDALEVEYKAVLDRMNDKWAAAAINQISEIPLTPQRKDIYVELFGIAWQPYFILHMGNQQREIPAFKPAPR
jgi:hypothetical protein